MNQVRKEDNRASGHLSAEQKRHTFKMFLKNKRVVIALISSIFAMNVMLFYNTIYSDQLISMGVSQDYIGYIFALGCLVYSIFCPIVGYLSKYMPKIYLTQISFLVTFVSLIMFGPSQVLGFP